MHVIIDKILLNILPEQSRQANDQSIRITLSHPYLQLITVISIRMQSFRLDPGAFLHTVRRLKYIHCRDQNQLLRRDPADVLLCLQDQLHIPFRRLICQIFLGPQSGIDQQIRFRSKGFLYIFRMIDCVEAAFAVQIAAYKSCVAY